MFECPHEEIKGLRSLGITHYGAELVAPQVRDGVLVSSSSVESPVKNPKRAYISSASLRKLKDSSS